jgi:membrane protein implicated in regulation of membrane protease activity
MRPQRRTGHSGSHELASRYAPNASMNRAFLIIGAPAIATSVCWLTYGWGWQRAILVTGIELAAIVAAVVYLLRRENAGLVNPRARR